MAKKYYESGQENNGVTFESLLGGDAKREAQQRQKVQSQSLLTNLSGGVVSQEGEANFSKWDADEAIRDISDMCERTMINFMALGELARVIKEKTDEFNGEYVEIGMPEKNLTPEIKSLFKTWKFTPTEYGYTYNYTPPTKWEVKVPVRIIVYKNNYSFFNNPDRGHYMIDDFYLPNPFKEYWEHRKEIN